MLRSIAAGLALAVAGSANGQQILPDLSTTAPANGVWTYRATSDGSEAMFSVANAPQVVLHCTRATRRVSVAKAATAAAPLLSVWTSSGTRSLPAGFTPATNRLTAIVPAFDPVLDAIAFSRGRVGFVVAGTPALVVPDFAEIDRVVEDCRG